MRRAGAGACSTIRASPSCSAPAAAPRCRSSAASRATARTIAVSGQVDRLAVTADAVLIADYKTNRPPPRRLEDVPPAYVTQLALYRAVLGQLYPGKAIRAALVWTDVPDLMEISAAGAGRRAGSRHLAVKPP